MKAGTSGCGCLHPRAAEDAAVFGSSDVEPECSYQPATAETAAVLRLSWERAAVRLKSFLGPNSPTWIQSSRRVEQVIRYK